MSRLRALRGRLWDWWAGISDQGQIALVGLTLLGLGGAFVWPPAGLLGPGLVLTAISMNFSLADRFVAIAFVVATGFVLVASLVAGGS